MKLYYQDIGNRLYEIACEAKNEIVIVSPFMKVNAIVQLLESVNKPTFIKCITRWRPDEIAQGLNDLEIWEHFNKRGNSIMLLYGDLHAKYYRFDDTVIIGSANLTGKALGWSSNSNLELMLEFPKESAETHLFEKNLCELSTSVNRSIYNYMLELVNRYEEKQDIDSKCEHIDYETTFEITMQQSTIIWVPKLRNPELLYKVYSNDTNYIIETTIQSACFDLVSLQIPPGLNENDFNSYVKGILLQQPIINKVDSYLTEPKRFGAMCDYLRLLLNRYGIYSDPTMTWQAIMRWMLYFLADKYVLQIPRHSEVIHKRNDL